MSFDPSLPFTPTYLFGVYLAARALPKSCLLVDGPDCNSSVAESYFANHDWQNPINAFPYATLVTTHKNLEDMALGNEERTRLVLSELSQNPEIKLFLLMGSAALAMLGTRHRGLLLSLADTIRQPIIEIPSKELHGDWQDGYQDVLFRLAQALPLPDVAKAPNKVALVGYLFDRFEGDQLANLKEIKRLLAALGLEVCSIWLSGEEPESLARAAEASWIVSLPQGRKAAELLSKRLGVPQLQAPLPIGIESTERFLRLIARAVGREEHAEAFILAEERRIWNAPLLPQGRWLQDRRIVLATEPQLLEPLCEFFTFMGARLIALSTNARRCPQKAALEERYGLPVAFCPTRDSLPPSCAKPEATSRRSSWWAKPWPSAWPATWGSAAWKSAFRASSPTSCSTRPSWAFRAS